MNDGKLIRDDDPVSTVEAYLESFSSVSNSSGSFEARVPGLRVESIKLDEEALEYGFNKPLKFDLHVRTEKDFEGLRIVLQILNSLGARISNAKVEIPKLERGDSVISVVMENHHLPPGHYRLNLVIHKFDRAVLLENDLLSFSISEIGIDDSFLVSRRDKMGACIPAKYYIQKGAERGFR